MAIPRIIHQIWMQGRAALPPRYERACQRWAQVNASWEHRLWDEASLLAFMEESAPQWLPLYVDQKEFEARADVGRYAILEQFGGLYADVDTHCVRPIDLFCSNGTADLRVQIYSPVLWRRSRYHPIPFDHLANSVIASAPGHPIWKHVRKEIGRRNDPQLFIPVRTGPLMLWPIVRDFALRRPHEVQFIGRKHILTSFFLPRPYMYWYGLTRRNVCILDFNDSGRAAARRTVWEYLKNPLRLAARSASGAGEGL